MAGLPPVGEPAPTDGALAAASQATVPQQPLAFYLHVPYCATRCGYCDFNTYTAEELGPSVSRATWAESAMLEVDFAGQVLGERTPPVHSVFIGGGTPTLLPSADLVRVISHVRDRFGFAEDVEITTEANPDSVTPESLAELRAGGLNRISFGMQSTSERVLASLERTHRPGRSLEAVRDAQRAGFENINVDLIFGTPGETDDDLRRSLDDVVALGVQHVSAYALIVEEGTRLARRISRGETPAPDDDVQADRYELVDQVLGEAGFEWYEISNWSRPGFECRHNLAYWEGTNWWGVGPGAHSHVGGTRWWNERHPATWTRALAEGRSPAQAREFVAEDDRVIERIMLQTRIKHGLSVWELDQPALNQLGNLVEHGLIEDPRVHDDRVVLTLRGRLLADVVVHALLP
jgi:putative oxygen-independent coproporphyrinogen III oxidase